MKKYQPLKFNLCLILLIRIHFNSDLKNKKLDYYVGLLQELPLLNNSVDERNILCLDKHLEPIFKIPNRQNWDSNCTYSPKLIIEDRKITATSFKKLIKIHNENCKSTHLCFAACQHSDCLAADVTYELIQIKKTSIVRFVTFVSFFIGFFLCFMFLLYLFSKQEINQLIYKIVLTNSFENEGFESSENNDGSDLRLSNADLSIILGKKTDHLANAKNNLVVVRKSKSMAR